MTVVPQQLELIHNPVLLNVCVSTDCSDCCARWECYYSSKCVFDRPPPDQTSWPWSGHEIKQTNESNKSNISEYTTLVVIPFRCEWFWMNTNVTQEGKKVSGSSWQQRCSALTGCGRVIQKSDRVNSEWWWHPSAKAQDHIYPDDSPETCAAEWDNEKRWRNLFALFINHIFQPSYYITLAQIWTIIGYNQPMILEVNLSNGSEIHCT